MGAVILWGYVGYSERALWEKIDLGDASEAGRSSEYFLHHTSSKSLPYVLDKGCERKERKMTRVAAQPYLIAWMFSTASVSELLRSVEGYVKVSRTTQTEVRLEKLFGGSYMGIKKNSEPLKLYHCVEVSKNSNADIFSQQTLRGDEFDLQ